MAVLLKESAWFRERVVSFRSDPDRFLAGVMTFVPPAAPRFPARSGSRPPSRPATPPNSACGSQSEAGGFHRLAGTPEAFGHLPTLAARRLP
jgi:hypothetical protein